MTCPGRQLGMNEAAAREDFGGVLDDMLAGNCPSDFSEGVWGTAC
jgi:hypothetical protein